MTKQILVVDDEADFSELLQFRLRACQYEVVAAATGAEALAKARTQLPDLVLLDLMLPDLDGLTLCRMLRRLRSARRPRIIMISAASSEATRHSARIAGTDDFLTKPVDFDDLQARLEVLLADESRPAGEQHHEG